MGNESLPSVWRQNVKARRRNNISGEVELPSTSLIPTSGDKVKEIHLGFGILIPQSSTKVVLC